MINKLIKIGLIGNTNAGKSTLINSFVGEKVSIINKKINTTQETILGIKNINETQVIFYDTPGSNFLKTKEISQKKFKTNLWQALDNVDYVLYIIDVLKYDYEYVKKDLNKINEVDKPIIFIFNKVDLIDNKKILPLIDELKNIEFIKDFFIISAKYNKGLDKLTDYLISKSYVNNWIFNQNEITDKDDIYITNECTRNSILDYLHKEIPYNVKVNNLIFKYLKNKDLKIKQTIDISNIRYKPIILGKKGENIKKIRERSQKEIQKIFNCKIHLYLHINLVNED